MRGVCVVFLVGLEDHDIGEKMERKGKGGDLRLHSFG